MKTKAQQLTELFGSGYCDYETRIVEEHGQVVSKRGWWHRQTPNGESYGPSYKAEYIGANFDEAEEHYDIHWS